MREELELDEKGIAARPEPAEVDSLQHLAPEALEAARTVADREAGDHAGVAVAADAQREALDIPVDHADAGEVPRPEGDVRGLGEPDQSGKAECVVARIAVARPQ